MSGMTHHPRVSVIIPTFNATCTIAKAVESVLAQTFRDLEIIVVDDGSTDDTAAIAAAYRDRIIYIYQENQERAAARNRGLAEASGEYVAFLDADDLWAPAKLERQVAVLDAHPEVLVVYSQATVIDGAGRPRLSGYRPRTLGSGPDEPAFMLDRLVLSNCVPMSTSVARLTAVRESGGFDVRFRYPEDWDLWLRLASRGRFTFLAEPLASYRVESEERAAAAVASEPVVAQGLLVIGKASAAGLAPELRAAAAGRLYVRAAVAACVLGDVELARSYFARAVLADPGLIETAESLTWTALQGAHDLAADAGPARAGAYLRTFFASLPSGLGALKAAERLVLADFWISTATGAAAHGDRTALRQALGPALEHAPGWLANQVRWRGGMLRKRMLKWRRAR